VLFRSTCIKALLELGFVQSTFDACFLFRHDMFIIIYVDDCGIAAKTIDLVDDLLKDLEERGFRKSGIKMKTYLI
jgi:hypothetical protein